MLRLQSHNFVLLVQGDFFEVKAEAEIVSDHFSWGSLHKVKNLSWRDEIKPREFFSGSFYEFFDFIFHSTEGPLNLVQMLP